MTLKKKRTKKYQPKAVNPNATYEAIMLAQPLGEGAIKKMINDVHVAILALSRGVGSDDHFNKLAAMIDVSNMLINGLLNPNGESAEYLEAVNKARDGLIRIRDRHARTQRIVFDGEGLAAINSVVYIYEVVMRNVTGHEFVKVVAERERQLALGNYFKGTSQDLKAAA